MLAIFFYALVFGFVFCLSPGAVLAETLRRGLQHGFTPALLVQVGSLVGDAVWAVIGLTGIALLIQHDAVRVPLTLLCALYLAWHLLERYGKETLRLYGVLDKQLAGRDFVATAGEPSIADFAILGWAWRAERHLPTQGKSITDFPHVARWHDAMMARPATKRGFGLVRRRGEARVPSRR